MNNLNKIIDLTYLKPDSDKSKIDELCRLALKYNVCTVCVPPYFAQYVLRHLENKPVKVSTVIGFPYGYHPTQVKAEEIRKAVDDDVKEIDVVANIAAIKSGDWNYVTNDIDSVVRLGHMRNLLVKWIIEINALTKEEIETCCKIAADKEVDFVKTGTGTFGPDVTPEQVRQLRLLLPDTVKIKASGGIRTREQALALVEAGAARIGTSSVEILTQAAEM